MRGFTDEWVEGDTFFIFFKRTCRKCDTQVGVFHRDEERMADTETKLHRCKK